MEVPVTLLCKNPSSDPEKRMEQAIMCAIIEGYTDATAEISKFISKLYREKDPNASLIHDALKPLMHQQNERYSRLVSELNGECRKEAVISSVPGKEATRIVHTPAGDMVAYPKHMSKDYTEDYPGIYIDCVSPDGGLVCMACVEYDSADGTFLGTLYANGDSEEPTSIEHFAGGEFDKGEEK